MLILAPRGSLPPCELGGSARQDYKVCLVRRAQRSTFMPDITVFPGGAVDPEDLHSAASLLNAPPGDLEPAIRCAAVREAFEEVGIGIFRPFGALQGLLSRGEMKRQAWRQRLHKDPLELGTLCAAAQIRPAVADLLPWCSFVTPDVEHERLKKGGFDARFYVWPVPAAAAEEVAQASADGAETTSLLWLSPDEALEAHASGRLAMAPPQWYILRELADHCPFLSGVAEYSMSAARAVRRDYLIKPFLLKFTLQEQAERRRKAKAAWGERASSDSGPDETPVIAMVYPGDEKHPIYPGPLGARHRMLVHGRSLVGPSIRFEFELSSPEVFKLPLREVIPNWHRLAKL